MPHITGIPPLTNEYHVPDHLISVSELGSSRSPKSRASLTKDNAVELTSMATRPEPQLRTMTSSSSLGKSPGSMKQKQQLNQNSSYHSIVSAPTNKTAPSSPIDTHARTTDRDTDAKMYQTSSKTLRMTDTDRPFTRDFKDLFATLIISLPLSSHRVMFSKHEETFLSEEAITNLGSLKFSQSNRIPDPVNPQRSLVTTTTTTFSMARDMARQVCQRFVDARLIESAEGKIYTQFPLKGAIWRLTPKGIQILRRFCDRNGVESERVASLLQGAQTRIVVLERHPETDKLVQDKTMIEVLFRRMVGIDGPNLQTHATHSDSESLSDAAPSVSGIEVTRNRAGDHRHASFTFTGKAVYDWLLNCCTTVDRRETLEICELFVRHQLMASVMDDGVAARDSSNRARFQPSKHAIYVLTEKGRRICGCIPRHDSTSSEDSADFGKDREQRRRLKDTNVSRFQLITEDAALRMLFREHLRASLCEENLNFFIEAKEFLAAWDEHEDDLHNPLVVKEFLATAYSLYNSFLAAGAPSELNIDHCLRSRLDACMTQTNSDGESMLNGLLQAIELIEFAAQNIAKLMASDSVPKFMRDPRYRLVIQEHQADLLRARSPTPSDDDLAINKAVADLAISTHAA